MIDLYKGEFLKVKVTMQEARRKSATKVKWLKPELIGYTGFDKWAENAIYRSLSVLFAKWYETQDPSQAPVDPKEWLDAFNNQTPGDLEKNIKNKYFKMMVWFNPDDPDPSIVEAIVVGINFGKNISNKDAEAIVNL